MKTDYTVADVTERLLKDEAFRREFLAVLVELKMILIQR